jgi:2-phosphoglycolate phosphatase
MNRIAAMLFDLDGTLADTAADLTAALNAVMTERGLAPLPLEQTRAHVSLGAAALIRLGLGAGPGDPGFAELRQAFLAYYRDHLCIETRLFPGIERLLDDLAARGVAWGIVTNKPVAYTLPLLRQLQLPTQPGAVVCGDTMAHSKPHPAPIREACRLLDASPSRAAYVGDDLRDIVAGFRAGTATVAVRWGYLGIGTAVERWGADRVVSSSDELRELL